MYILYIYILYIYIYYIYIYYIYIYYIIYINSHDCNIGAHGYRSCPIRFSGRDQSRRTNNGNRSRHSVKG